MTELSRVLLGVACFFLLIALPLLAYLKKRGLSNVRMVSYFFLNYVFWYLPYAPIHEGAHFIGGRISGMHAKSFQFLPRFWRGDFVNGYIEWSDGLPWQMALSTQAPYVIDGFAVLFGYLLFRRRHHSGALLGALILTQTFLRSVFDVAVNYSAGTLGRTGDFRFLLGVYPPLAVHVGAWAVMLLGSWCAVREIMKARQLSQEGSLRSDGQAGRLALHKTARAQK